MSGAISEQQFGDGMQNQTNSHMIKRHLLCNCGLKWTQSHHVVFTGFPSLQDQHTINHCAKCPVTCYHEFGCWTLNGFDERIINEWSVTLSKQSAFPVHNVWAQMHANVIIQVSLA